MACSGDGGFRFSFGGDEGEEAAPAPPPRDTAAALGAAPLSYPAPTIRLSSFPWVTLTEDIVAEWGGAYPRATQNAGGRRGVECAGTRPQQLTFPETAPEYVVCYQTAPEIPALTTVRQGEGKAAEAEGAVETGEARDIVPGKYYGGLKVWSCAPDLARYLMAHAGEWRGRFSGSDGDAAPPLVAEVGCGQAVPALAAALLGARRLILQDFNAEVLEACVKPNLAVTMRQWWGRPSDSASSASPSTAPPLEVKLVDGDWIDLDLSHGNGEDNWEAYADVILGADVTFDQEACGKLATLLSRWLRPQGPGIALIATKVFYFGTNGGSSEFAECAARCGLCVAEAARIDDDGGMKRVILRVTRPA